MWRAGPIYDVGLVAHRKKSIQFKKYFNTNFKTFTEFKEQTKPYQMLPLWKIFIRMTGVLLHSKDDILV